MSVGENVAWKCQNREGMYCFYEKDSNPLKFAIIVNRELRWFLYRDLCE